MTDTPDTRSKAHKPAHNWRNAEEPWPFWAGVLVFLNIVVFATMPYGRPGLVTVMVPAAIGMLVVVLLIATGR